MQPPLPSFNGLLRNILHKTCLMGLLGLALSGISCSKKAPNSPIVFGRLPMPASTNAAFVYVTITNQSDSDVVYLAWPAQVRSNGLWIGPLRKTGQRLNKLPARGSGVLVFEAASLRENVRIPILWGYQYADLGRKPTRWKDFMRDIKAQFKGHGSVGLLYTNYLTDLKP